MTEPPSSWPPPPETPNLLAVHDEFLADCVHHHPRSNPLSSPRLFLARRLHQKTGRDLRYCRAVVNNFCHRHTIFMPGFGSWFSYSLPTVCAVVIFVMLALGYFLENREVTAVTPAARLMFHHYAEYDYFGMGGIASILVLAEIVDSVYSKKEWAEAMTKFGGIV